MPNFATKEKLGLAQNHPPPPHSKEKNKHCCHQIYIFDFSISSKKYKRMIEDFLIARNILFYFSISSYYIKLPDHTKPCN
jgi:hypothetical protein